MNKKEGRELKKQIWNRRRRDLPHLIEISTIYKLIETLIKHKNDFKKPCPKCNGSKGEIDYDNGIPMPHRYCSICNGRGFIKS